MLLLYIAAVGQQRPVEGHGRARPWHGTVMLRMIQGVDYILDHGLRQVSPAQVAKIAQHADGVVVGSAIIQYLVDSQSVAKTLEYVKDLANSTRITRSTNSTRITR